MCDAESSYIEKDYRKSVLSAAEQPGQGGQNHETKFSGEPGAVQSETGLEDAEVLKLPGATGQRSGRSRSDNVRSVKFPLGLAAILAVGGILPANQRR